MKTSVKLTLTIWTLFLCFGLIVAPTYAQSPIGAAKEPAQSPVKPKPVKPNKPRPKPPSNSDKSGVPTGKSIGFYVDKSAEFIDAGDYDMAVRYLNEADKKRKDKTATPGLLDILDKQQQVAKLYLESEQLTDAEADKTLANYKEILKLRPTDQKARESLPDLYCKIATQALDSKNYDKAIGSVDELLQSTPDKPEAKEILVKALQAQADEAFTAGKEDLALKDYKRLLGIDPKNQLAQTRLRALDLKSLLEFAENKLKSEAYEDALTKFKEVLSIDANNEQAKKGLQLAQGNYQKQKGEQFYNNRKYTEAENEFKEALTILPDDEKMRTRLAEIALRLSPVPATKGKTTWRGRANGSGKVKIKGDLLSYDGDVVSGSVSDRLPAFGYQIKKAKKTSGGGDVTIAEQPTTSNSYTTVISVNAKKPGDVAFELEWELARQGRITWRGDVGGHSLIRIQGPFVDLEQVSGEAAKDINYQVEALPKQDATVAVKKISGAAEVKVVESPSAANQYMATISVESANEKPETLALEISWQLK